MGSIAHELKKGLRAATGILGLTGFLVTGAVSAGASEAQPWQEGDGFIGDRSGLKTGLYFTVPFVGGLRADRQDRYQLALRTQLPGGRAPYRLPQGYSVEVMRLGFDQRGLSEIRLVDRRLSSLNTELAFGRNEDGGLSKMAWIGIGVGAVVLVSVVAAVNSVDDCEGFTVPEHCMDFDWDD